MPLVLSLLDVPRETERLVPLSLEERKARTFALLRHLVLYEAQRQPCILAVENLHWSDATSEEWLTSLVERLTGAALLVLVTYRPGYQSPWLAQSYATQMALSPLRAEDSRTVVQAVLQTASVPETVVQEIVTHAAGNPFFLEELAWNVIEHGGQPVPRAVPETIEAVLAARIDRLPPEEKRLLQTAVVIGMAVSVPLLQAVTDIGAAELHTHLGHLQTAEFLYETGKLPAAAYTFKHALTHEVAYEVCFRSDGVCCMGAPRKPSRGSLPSACRSTTTRWPITIVAAATSSRRWTTRNAPGNRRWSARPMPRRSAT